MEESKFKVGARVKCVKTFSSDNVIGVNAGSVGVVDAVIAGVPHVRFDGLEITNEASNNRNGAWAMYASQLELVPFEIPASPFYVVTDSGNKYEVSVDGLRYSLTAIKEGIHFPRHAETRLIPGHFSSGGWTLIDPPAPAVDTVAAAAADVQRLLREKHEADAACNAAQDAQDIAEEVRRNIGKHLTEAKRALDKANHDAAGVEFSQS